MVLSFTSIYISIDIKNVCTCISIARLIIKYFSLPNENLQILIQICFHQTIQQC